MLTFSRRLTNMLCKTGRDHNLSLGVDFLGQAHDLDVKHCDALHHLLGARVLVPPHLHSNYSEEGNYSIGAKIDDLLLVRDH